jgi:cell division protein FtsW (lipid II flippase)
MGRNGVSPTIWVQQLVAGLLLATVCAVAYWRRRPTTERYETRWIIAAAAVLVILALTLLHPGVDGVRRWISLGPLQLHAGFVALPVIIILAGTTARSESSSTHWIACACIVTAAAVLAFQPDASQAIAFAVAVVVVILQSKQRSRIEWIAATACVGASVLALSQEDPLEPVPHVEGIVGLAASTGALWLVAAIVALLLLPIPFVMSWFKRRDHNEGLGLAAYFVTVCVAAFVTPFPVPVLGYGLSPILGYFFALGWIVRTDALPATSKTDRKQSVA